MLTDLWPKAVGAVQSDIREQMVAHYQRGDDFDSDCLSGVRSAATNCRAEHWRQPGGKAMEFAACDDDRSQ
jgi:hypothetical protein